MLASLSRGRGQRWSGSPPRVHLCCYPFACFQGCFSVFIKVIAMNIKYLTSWLRQSWVKKYKNRKFIQVLKVINGRVRSGRNGNWRGLTKLRLRSTAGPLASPPFPLASAFHLCLSANCLSSLFWASPLCHHSVYGALAGPSANSGFYPAWLFSLALTLWLCLSVSQLQGPQGGMSEVDGLIHLFQGLRVRRR